MWFKAWWTTFRFRHTLLEMLVALSLAFLVWLYTHSRAQDSIDRVQVPVLIQLAPSQRDLFLLETNGSPNVTASFAGPSSRIRELRHNLQRGLVQATVTLNVAEERLSETSFSESVHVEASHLEVPAGVLAFLGEERGGIPVTVHRLTERQLPVKLDTTGEVRVTQIHVEPATVLVRGPKQVLDHAQVILTKPFAMTVPTSADGLVRDQIALVSEMEGRGVVTAPRLVTFQCKAQPRKKTYELTDVPVRFVCPEQFPWRARFLQDQPGKVRSASARPGRRGSAARAGLRRPDRRCPISGQKFGATSSTITQGLHPRGKQPSGNLVFPGGAGTLDGDHSGHERSVTMPLPNKRSDA